MGRHVVGWFPTLWFTPDSSGNTVLQFPENSATGERKNTNYRKS